MDADDELGPGYELETIMEHRVAMLKLIRLSRVTAIHDELAPPGSESAAASVALAGEGEGASATLDRAAFECAWIRNLP